MKSRRPARLALFFVPAVILVLILMGSSLAMAQDSSGPFTSSLLNKALSSGDSSLVLATADTGPTVFTNNEPFPSTNDPMEPISVNFSDPDGIYPFEYPKMFYDGYELTKCGSNMPGVTFTSGGPNPGISWDHETVTVWGPRTCDMYETAFVPMADGEHTVTITVKDGAWSPADPTANQTTFSWSFFIDNTLPAITNSAICGTVVETDSPTVSFGYSDTSGIDSASVKMYIDDVPTAAGAVYVSAAEAVYTPTGLVDGLHTATIHIKDNGGNPATSTCSFTVDTQPPVIGEISPADGERVGTSSPLIDIAWSDAGAGVDQYTAHLELDGVDVTGSASLAQYGLTYQASGLALGTHSISVYVKDNTGKQSLTKTSSFRYSTPVTYYAPWYDSKAANGMKGNWIMISNQESTEAVVDVFIGSEQMVGPDDGHWNIAGGGRAEPAFGNMMNGPVRIVSTNGNELLVSQRVLFRNSFNEVPAVRENELDSEYRFTWYDSKPENNMSGNWILIGNVDPSSSAVVDVYVGDSSMGSWTIAPGGIVTPGTGMPQFNNLMDGPVKVKSRGGEKLIVSQRVLYKEAFSEVMGTPVNQLGNEYHFTWYDWQSAGMNGNYIMVSNESASVNAYVDIEIGGTKMAGPAGGQWMIPPGSRVTPFFQGVQDGPVEVSCASCEVYGSKIMASQRVIYKNSFEEVQGMIPDNMGDSAVFTWYDWQSPEMKGDWLLIGNQNASTDAYMEIYIGAGGSPMSMNGQSGFMAASGGGIALPYFTGVMGGPVKAVCTTCAPGQKLIISQRVLYLDSFNEVVGRPPVK
ncbi:MAG: Ig-like domain-containing protein [Thermoleophilia bacterium]